MRSGEIDANCAMLKRRKDRQYVAYVVPHTHWDRAWYLPFEQFRVMLVDTFDKLLKIYRTDPRFNAFSFDGQTVVLEDYLQIRPENEKPIRKLVGAGKLAVGPWYVLPDEFLVSGEAIIRNLLIGHDIAGSFGRVTKVGYIPDPFGHVSQMPQILRGFGIDSMIFSRGSGRRVKQAGLVFKWVGSDGPSWVHAVLQAGMYANLAAWGVPQGQPTDTVKVDYPLALQQVENLIDLMERLKSPTRVLLFNNGFDHAPAQPKVPDMIDYVNKHQDKVTLVQGTFEDFIAALRKDHGPLAPVQGELHEGMEVGLLSGIFSTRMYIKQANASAQTLIEKFSEPLSTFSWLLGESYPAPFLLYAWKELLKCHPHDDIGGCSVDSVHEDDMNRFRRVQQVGEAISSKALGDIARNVNFPAQKGIIVYNPLSFPNTGEVRLSIPFRRRELPPNPRLLDPAGSTVPAVFQWSGMVENLPVDKRSDFGELSISFLAENVPPCGYRLYTLVEGREQQPKMPPRATDHAIENEFFQVTPNPNGTANLRDKETGIIYEELNFFEDLEDAGDEYDYSPLPAFRSVRITSHKSEARLSLVHRTPYKQSIDISLEMRVPRGLKPDRTARSAQMVSLPIRSTVTLFRGIRRVDFDTTVENRACDHRLRAAFPTGIRAMAAHAESKFDVVRRPFPIPRYTERYYQPPVATKHVETFVDVHDGRRGFALLNQGLPEYEARQEAGGVVLYQTLFRSVGWLSRPDLLTRARGGAGPARPTPGAQMLGTWTFRYSLVPHRGSWEDSAMWQAAQSFTSPMKAHLCETGAGNLPTELSFLTIEPATAVLSCVKRSESGRGIIVRFYNPTSRDIRARLRFFRPLSRACLVRLDETPLKPLRVAAQNALSLSVAAKQIITLQLYPRA